MPRGRRLQTLWIALTLRSLQIPGQSPLQRSRVRILPGRLASVESVDPPMEAPPIPGVRIVPLSKYADSRGWLTELFRNDELPEGFKPTMGYLSVTHAGAARGPHEHADQTDCFAFLSGQFEL